MTGDLLSLVNNLNTVDIPLHRHLFISITYRDRIKIPLKRDKGLRTYKGACDLACSILYRRKRQERRFVFLEPDPNRLFMPS